MITGLRCHVDRHPLDGHTYFVFSQDHPLVNIPKAHVYSSAKGLELLQL